SVSAHWCSGARRSSPRVCWVRSAPQSPPGWRRGSLTCWSWRAGGGPSTTSPAVPTRRGGCSASTARSPPRRHGCRCCAPGPEPRRTRAVAASGAVVLRAEDDLVPAGHRGPLAAGAGLLRRLRLLGLVGLRRRPLVGLGEAGQRSEVDRVLVAVRDGGIGGVRAAVGHGLLG